jgi:hypothetical protein
MSSITIYHEYKEVKSYANSLVITGNGKKIIYYALPKGNALPIKALSMLAELARRMLGRRFGRGTI